MFARSFFLPAKLHNSSCMAKYFYLSGKSSNTAIILFLDVELNEFELNSTTVCIADSSYTCIKKKDRQQKTVGGNQTIKGYEKAQLSFD